MITLTVAGVDQSCEAIYALDISVGRSDIHSQPDGSTLSAEFIGWAPAGRVGDLIVVTDSALGRLFYGLITDVTAELDDNLTWSAKISAVGPLAVLGHILAGYAAYPVETDSRRVRRVLDETRLGPIAYVDTTVAGPDLAARDNTLAEPENAADLARFAADSGLGVLWEWPNEVTHPIRYMPAKYRSWDGYTPSWGELPAADTWPALPDGMAWHEADSDNVPIVGLPPAYELDPCAVMAALTFEQALGDVARTVKVQYGAPEASARPAPVIAGNLYPSKDFDTWLDAIGDATSYAETMLKRMEHPTWRLESATIQAELLTPEAQLELRHALQVGARITIPLPHGSPVGTSWQGFLEGWDEHLEPNNHAIDLHISDRFLTEHADRWEDIPLEAAWQTLLDTTRWIDTTSVGGTL